MISIDTPVRQCNNKFEGLKMVKKVVKKRIRKSPYRINGDVTFAEKKKLRDYLLERRISQSDWLREKIAEIPVC